MKKQQIDRLKQLAQDRLKQLAQEISELYVFDLPRAELDLDEAVKAINHAIQELERA